MEFLQSIDTYLFFLVNHNLSNGLFDKFFPFITENKHWLLVYIFLMGFMLWKGGIKGRKFFVVMILTILISDQLSSSIIKPLIDRTRPCFELQGVNLLITIGPGKSFPSSHAVNNFAAATVISYFYKDYKIILYFIASLVAFSRVYVGVHYPFDILAGAVIGILVGYLMIFLEKKLPSKWN